jgi:hypothetical protein
VPSLQELDSDLTTNFFSRLAFEIGTYYADPNDRGVVGTPPILARDMVALAAALWLSSRVSIPTETLLKIVFNDSRASEAHLAAIAQLLSVAKWYDPFIGGGVFPIAILLFLNRFGVRLQDRLDFLIEGCDVDPIAVTVTNIRVSMVVSTLTGESYERVRSTLPPIFKTGNSLERATEQLVASVHSTQGGEGVSFEGGEAFSSSVDLVVGNPPYIRADRMSLLTKNFLKNAYPSVASGQADLYNYFIAHGLLALKPSGILCYISPASFQKSRYGGKTREFIDQQGSLQVLFDFN